MLLRVGAEADLVYDGLEMLARMPVRLGLNVATGLGDAVKRSARHFLRSRPAYHRFLRRIRECDLIVVVDGLPHPFLRGALRLEQLRRQFPEKPIVLYDLFYLGTRGPWAKWIQDGNPDKSLPPGGHGLERFDWYLTASVVSEVALPAEPQPLSLIGVDLDDGTLHPEPKSEFLALLDFEHPPDMGERAIQILACAETGTKFEVLNGSYSIAEIRAMYRKSSVFFLSMRESFGLPICEVQACGAYVFTPHSNWQPAHWLKGDPHVPGPGTLSENFIVYGNDKEILKGQIERIKSSYDPARVTRIFRHEAPAILSRRSDCAQRVSDPGGPRRDSLAQAPTAWKASR